MSEKIKDVNNLEVGDFVSVFIRGNEISGDPSLKLKLGDVLYGIPIIVEAINEKDAEYKAIKEFKDNFYTIDEVLVTHLLEEW